MVAITSTIIPKQVDLANSVDNATIEYVNNKLTVKYANSVVKTASLYFEQSSISNAPVSVAGAGAGATSDYVYLFGGYDYTNVLSSAYKYSVINDTWNAIASMPSASYNHSCATINGKIYIAFGRPTTTSTGSNKCWEYDPTTNNYTTKTSAPISAYARAYCSLNGLFYNIAGITSSYINTCHYYDPSTNTWTTIANYPISAGWFCETASLNDKIYVFGGYNGSNLTNAYVYDANANTWTAIASLGTARRGHVAVSEGSVVMIYGGYTTTFTSDAIKYDPSTNSYTSETAILSAKQNMASTQYLGKTYLMCGEDGTGALNSAQYRVSRTQYVLVE
jgi:N-acetylneuraminic acid mutarotase